MATTTTKSIYNIFAKAAKIIGKDPKDPSFKKWFVKRKHEMEIGAQIQANKDYYINCICKPFEWYSIFDDDALKSANFDNYDTSFSDEAKRNYYKAGKITKQYFDGGEFNTLLVGPSGRGKSHLALSILKSVLKTRKPTNSGIFADVNEMMQKIKNGFDNHRPVKDQVLKHLADAYLIVLDDLGAEHISDFDREVLLAIINSNHRVIVTTNLMPKDIEEKYGERIYSRLLRGMRGHVIQFTEATKDHRRL